MDHHFEVFQDNAGQYRFRFRANNGNIIASSPKAYQATTEAKAEIQRIQKGRIDAELYVDNAGEHRWRMTADNHIVATGSEGYTAKASAKNGLASVLKRAPAAAVQLVD